MNAFMTNEKNNALTALDAYKVQHPDKAELIDMFSEFTYRLSDNVEITVEMCRPSDTEPGAYESYMSSDGQSPWITVNVESDNIYFRVASKNIRTCFCLNEVGDITYLRAEDHPNGKFYEAHFTYKGFEYWFKIFDWKK